MPDRDPLDRLFDAVKKDRIEKEDAEYDKLLNEVKPELPDFIREAIDKGAFLKPSDFAENPGLESMRQLVLLRAQIEDLREDFNLAMGLLRAVTVTYGVPDERYDGGHKIYVSNEVAENRPHCVDVHLHHTDDGKGSWVHVSPSDCNATHTPPGHGLN